MRDKTHPVVLEVEDPSPIVTAKRRDRTTLLTGSTATTKISRKAFGVLWNKLIEMMPVIGDEVTVTIDLELGRPAAPGGSDQAPPGGREDAVGEPFHAIAGGRHPQGLLPRPQGGGELHWNFRYVSAVLVFA